MVEHQRVARLANELQWLDLLTTGAAEIELTCECGQVGCDSRLTVSRRAYRSIRTHVACFIVASGHEQAMDRVVYRNEALAITEVE